MKLETTIKTLSTKGILAIDESPGSIGKRFQPLGVENSEENRQRYRDLLLTTPEIEDYLSGVILHDETYHQSSLSGTKFIEILKEKGIAVGIKVDTGKTQNGDHFLTTGIEDLTQRLNDYPEADFAKWRAVFQISESTPSEENINQNCDLLAEYAKRCQDANIVPIVEPEILRSGDFSVEENFATAEIVLAALMSSLERMKVDVSKVVLKPAMVTASEKSSPISPTQVAENTLAVFDRTLPSELQVVAFLSGGQSTDTARENLRTIQEMNKTNRHITFSFGRAIHQDVLEVWAGKDENRESAQSKLIENLKNLDN
jgi:fructose-bisphosphate aldolase class I